MEKFSFIPVIGKLFLPGGYSLSKYYLFIGIIFPFYKIKFSFDKSNLFNKITSLFVKYVLSLL